MNYLDSSLICSTFSTNLESYPPATSSLVLHRSDSLCILSMWT